MAKKSKMMKTTEDASRSFINIALYIRVSTDAQREEGYSIEIQTERLIAYIKSYYGNEVQYELYVDDGFSGGSLERPAMQRLIQDIKDKSVTHVVVYKLDRLSRSQKDTLYLIEDVMLPHNADFISMQESFNTATAFGRAVVGILSVFAQLERENIFERTRSGMSKRVEQGFWPGGGRVPYGYDYDASQGILVPNKDAETVRRVYHEFLNGKSLNTIAELCNLKYDRLAYSILTKKTNTGLIVYNGKEYKGLHEPIIDLETYERAMIMLQERSAKRYVSKTDHLLTGLVYCGKCGAKMRYAKWGKNGYKFVCYSQQTSKPYLIKDPDCDNEKVWTDEIEDIVIQDLFYMTQKNFQEETPLVKPMNALEVLDDQKQLLEKKLRRLYALFSESDDDILIESINALKGQIKAIDGRIADEQEKGVFSRELDRAKDSIKNIKDIWEYMSTAERRTALRSVVESIMVYPNNVHVNYKF